MDILQKIVAATESRVAAAKACTGLAALQQRIADLAPPSLLSAGFSNTAPNIIAEFKRKSPSKPVINLNAKPAEVALAYRQGGAAAMSVLTEPDFFAGSLDDIAAAQGKFKGPILRKDFMIDAYQFYEARAAGASLVLLIARILTPQQIRDFTQLSHELGMEVLLEIHERNEWRDDYQVDFLGVNCRDLKLFKTNLDRLVDMAGHLPDHLPRVAESGIHQSSDVAKLWHAGYRGFLVGEALMRHPRPERQVEAFRHAL